MIVSLPDLDSSRAQQQLPSSQRFRRPSILLMAPPSDRRTITLSSCCHSKQKRINKGHIDGEDNEIINTSKRRYHRCFSSHTVRSFNTLRVVTRPTILVALPLTFLLLLLTCFGSTMAWTHSTTFAAAAWRQQQQLASSSSCWRSTTTVDTKLQLSSSSSSPYISTLRSISSSTRPFGISSLVGPLGAAARRGRPPGKAGGKKKSNKNNNIEDTEGPATGASDNNEDEDDVMMQMMMMGDDDIDPEAAAAAAAAAAASDQEVEALLLEANLGGAEEEEGEALVSAVYRDADDDDDDEEGGGDAELQEGDEEDYDDDLALEVDDEDEDDDDEEEEEDDDEDDGVVVKADYYGYDDEDGGEYDATTSRLYQDLEDGDEDDQEYPLEDEPSDPNYQKQKQILEQTTKATDEWRSDEEFDEWDYIMNQMTPEEAEEIEQSPFQRQVEERAKKVILTEQDVLDYIGRDDPDALEKNVAEIPDLMDDDPYPRYDADGEEQPNLLEQDIGVTDDDMEALDTAWKTIRQAQKREPWDKVSFKSMNTDWKTLSDQTLNETAAALDELGGSAYDVRRWLLYDLDFNVSNLFLAAVKHNPKAPILFQHWYPQLVTYERYQHVRDRDFEMTWDDVQAADLSELELYYAGFGYDEIPLKAPAETGIISLEELDEEEVRMAAFEKWMTEVYNPEVDRKDFDDEAIRDEDNVFSPFYEEPQHPDVPSFEDYIDDLNDHREEMGHRPVYDDDDDEDDDDDDDDDDGNDDDETSRPRKYKFIHDEEFTQAFRGHLIVACTADDSDLDVAEKITLRMDEKFGKQVFVETRVMAHAREDDNVFEVWLESYEIDLLHSKKRAMSNNKDWLGPSECDDQQIDYLVERVGYLISDEARYSYRMDLEPTDF